MRQKPQGRLPLKGLHKMPPLDHDILEILAPLMNSSAGDVWAKIAARAGNGGIQALTVALFLLAGWHLQKEKIKRCTCSCLAALLLSGILVQLFKFTVGRGRPGIALSAWSFRPWTSSNNWHSFPSGHAASSFSIAAVFTAFYPRLWWLWYGVASFIGVGRVVRESHFPTDVVAGALLGSLCGGLCFSAVCRYFSLITSGCPNESGFRKCYVQQLEKIKTG